MTLLCLLLTILHAFIATSNVAAVPVTSPVTLQLSRLVNEKGIRNFIVHDQARAKSILEKDLGSGVVSTPLTSLAVSYIATIDVGSPPTSCMCTSLLPPPLMMLNMTF